MKKLLTIVALAGLAGTVVSSSALAEPGCDPGNSLNNLQASDCDRTSGYAWMGSTVITPMPWYGVGSYAYVPSRPLIRQRANVHNKNTSLQEETDLAGGSD